MNDIYSIVLLKICSNYFVICNYIGTFHIHLFVAITVTVSSLYKGLANLFMTLDLSLMMANKPKHV